jgi:hypothetical protein
LQKKNYEGGTLNNLGWLPYIPEDEPYQHAWRGPKGQNLEVMRTFNGQLIQHMPEEAEEYVIPIYRDKLICNCSYYATLYAILKLKAEHIIYYGMDFYNNFNIKKSWYVTPPRYNSGEWWDMRLRYEGEHMKVLYDDYLGRFFPNIKFEFFTTIDHEFKRTNILCNKVSLQDSNTAYYKH